MTDYSYIGNGKVHLRVTGSAAALIPVGNCSALRFAVTEDIKSLKDYTNTGGGTYNEVRRVEAVECSMTLHDLSADNLARAIFGTAGSVTAGAVADESVGDGYKGGISVTDYPIDTTASVTVEAVEGHDASARANSTAYSLGDYYVPATPNGYFYKCTTAGTSDSSPPTFGTTVGGTTTDGTATFTNMGKVALVEDTDYTASAGGITLTDDAAFTDGEELQVSYTKVAARTVEALLNSAQEYELFFDGLNDARSGKAVLVHAYRVKLGATDGLDLIGDDYYAGTQSGKVLKDTTKNGVSVSQYFKTTVVT